MWLFPGYSHRLKRCCEPLLHESCFNVYFKKFDTTLPVNNAKLLVHKIQNPAFNSFLKLLLLTTVPNVMNNNQIITDRQKTYVSLALPQSSIMEDWAEFAFKTQKQRNQTCASTSTTLQQLPGFWSLVDSFLCFSLWFRESRSDLSASHKTSRRMTTVSLLFRLTHTHTRALACGQCTDVITDIPGCYLFFIPLEDAFDKWYHK